MSINGKLIVGLNWANVAMFAISAALNPGVVLAAAVVVMAFMATNITLSQLVIASWESTARSTLLRRIDP